MTVYEKTGGGKHPPPEAYLDTNLVSGLAKGDLWPEELEALYRVIDLMHDGRVSLVTSPVTKKEIDRVPADVRAPHDAIYAFLAKIPAVDEQQLVPRMVKAGSGVSGPVVVEDADFAVLRAVLRHRDDALHVFHAIKNGSRYFVTQDDKTILKRAAEIEASFPILLRLPSQLIEDLDGVAAS